MFLIRKFNILRWKLSRKGGKNTWHIGDCGAYNVYYIFESIQNSSSPPAYINVSENLFPHLYLLLIYVYLGIISIKLQETTVYNIEEKRNLIFRVRRSHCVKHVI